MEYGLPQPETPTPTPVPLAARLHPGCLGLIVSQIVGALGVSGIYIWLEVTNTRGLSGLGPLIKAVLVVAALILVSFFVGFVWGVHARQK